MLCVRVCVWEGQKQRPIHVLDHIPTEPHHNLSHPHAPTHLSTHTLFHTPGAAPKRACIKSGRSPLNWHSKCRGTCPSASAIVAAAECAAVTGNKFSKVSSLLNLSFHMTTKPTFEKISSAIVAAAACAAVYCNKFWKVRFVVMSGGKLSSKLTFENVYQCRAPVLLRQCCNIPRVARFWLCERVCVCMCTWTCMCVERVCVCVRVRVCVCGGEENLWRVVRVETAKMLPNMSEFCCTRALHK